MAARYEVQIGEEGNPTYIFSYDDGSIVSMGGVFAVDVVGDELSVDQIDITVRFGSDIAQIFAPKDYSGGYRTADGYLYGTNATQEESRALQELPYGTMAIIYQDGALLAKNYVESVRRNGRTSYTLTTMSPVGLLARKYHTGGIYTGQAFSTVINGLIGTSFPYAVSDNIADALVFGWLPYATARDNLHQLLFAYGAVLTKDDSGNVKLAYLEDITPETVPASRIYDGGSVSYQIPATSVEVTEHTFLRLDEDEAVTVYDNTGSAAADRLLVTFQDAPVYDLTASAGLTVHESGVNYAIVSGTGTLTAKKYTHTTHVIAKYASSSGEIEPNVKRVTDATLVSPLNSNNVAQRLLSYYSSRKTVRNAIVYDGERCGSKYRFMSPYNEAVTAFLSNMQLTMSSIIKADCELITGYTPINQGNNYSSVIILEGSGTWTPPDGVTEVQAILVGGGQGGQGGEDGQSGKAGDRRGSTGGEGGPGGKPGQGGSGGKILTVTVQISGPVTYSCGDGGEGAPGGIYYDENGTPYQAEGYSGRETVFGGYSSDDGEESASGVANIFTGVVYALPGGAGIAGAAGGHGETGGTDAGSVTYNGTTWRGGSAGARENGWKSGYAYGGGGGGAAAGQNGGDGAGGETERNQGHGYNEGGNGGRGGNAADRAAETQFGQGGLGGHGGGGGGGGGGATGDSDGSGGYYYFPGSGGKAGSGGKGGKGGKGCIILYY